MPLQQGDPPWLGRYQLTARLGAGGMGVVYLGQADGRPPVAVKVLRPEFADDQEFRARFRREVQAMVRVQNRYTVRVLDADTDGKIPFLVTEYAEGPSLDEWVKTHGPIAEDAVIRLASALAEAIAAIHAAGVTHRDLKPSNVLLTDSGPMVIDFGIAQTTDSVSITRTGMAVGSPGYMAPEQIIGNAGQEADIFTWALIVAFASSGQPPFGTGQPPAIMHRVMNSTPDISAVPPRLQQLIQAAISKDPSRRPSAVDMVRDLAPGALGGISPRTSVDPGMAARTEVQQQGGTLPRSDSYGNGYPTQGYAQTRTMGAEGPGAWDEEPPTGPGRRGGMAGPDDDWDRPRRSATPWVLTGAAVIVVAVIVVLVFVLKPTNGNGTPAQTPAATTSSPAQQQTSAPTSAPVTQAPTTQAPVQQTTPTMVPTTPSAAPTTSASTAPSTTPGGGATGGAPTGGATGGAPTAGTGAGTAG